MDAITGEAGSYLPLSRSCLSESELRAQEQTKAQPLESSNHGRAPSKPFLSLSLSQPEPGLSNPKELGYSPHLLLLTQLPRETNNAGSYGGVVTLTHSRGVVLLGRGGSPLLTSPHLSP
jgi:hypothetical protein